MANRVLREGGELSSNQFRSYEKAILVSAAALAVIFALGVLGSRIGSRPFIAQNALVGVNLSAFAGVIIYRKGCAYSHRTPTLVEPALSEEDSSKTEPRKAGSEEEEGGATSSRVLPPPQGSLFPSSSPQVTPAARRQAVGALNVVFEGVEGEQLRAALAEAMQEDERPSSAPPQILMSGPDRLPQGWGDMAASYAPQTLMDWVIKPGTIQMRAYQISVEPILDLLLSHLGVQDTHILPLVDKVESLQHKRKEFQGALGPQIKGILNHIVKFADPHQNKYELRKELFELLNKAYSSHEYKVKDEGAHLLQEIAFVIFTKTDLHVFGEEAVVEAIGQGGGIPFPDLSRSIAQILQEDRDAIECSPVALRGSGQAGMKMKGHFNKGFKPVEENNVPNRTFSATYPFGEVDFIRFGSPTREDGEQPAQILESMRLFLDCCCRKKAKVLSFQHQDAVAKDDLSGNERPRLHAMVDLANEYQGTLEVVCLPFDGAFFKQKVEGEVESSVFLTQFKSEIRRKDNEQRYYFRGEHFDALDAILDKILSTYFNKGVLTQEERQVFMMLSHVYFEDYFIQMHRPQFVHNQCKDAMDRAMSLVSTIFYMANKQMGRLADRLVLNDFRTLVHTAPLLIKGIGMHGERFALLKRTIAFLEQFNGEMLPIGIERTTIHRALGQTFHPTPREAGIAGYDKAMHRHMRKEPHEIDFNIDYFGRMEEGLQFEKDFGRAEYLIGGKRIQLPEDYKQRCEEAGISWELIQKVTDPIVLQRSLSDAQLTAYLEMKKEVFKQKVRDPLLHNLCTQAAQDVVSFEWIKLFNLAGMERYVVQPSPEEAKVASCIYNVHTKDGRPFVEAILLMVMKDEKKRILHNLEGRVVIDVQNKRAMREWSLSWPMDGAADNYFLCLHDAVDFEAVM